MFIAIRRLRRSGLVLAATLVTAGALAAPGAHAAPLLVCPAGNISGTYTPALTNTPALVSRSVYTSYGTCVGVLPLTRTGGWPASLPAALRSCTDLLVSHSGVSHTVSWSTGTTSTFTVDTVSDYITGGILQTVETGSVTAGEFAGAHVAQVSLVAGSDPLACATTGVTTSSGPVTLTITP